MKKRLVKKWISRYIKPLVEELPQIHYFSSGRFENLTIVNGENVSEGCAYQIERDPNKAVKKQQQYLLHILEVYSGRMIYVRKPCTPLIHDNQLYHMSSEHWRKHPRTKFYGVGMHLLVEKV